MDPTLLLLRVAEDPRPHIQAMVVDQQVLAALDLVGGQTRIGWGPVYGAGLKTRRVRDRTGEWTRTTIPELHLGELVLYDVPARVEGTDDLVVGFRGIPEVEVALLNSLGIVKVAPAGSGLLDEMGPIEPVDAQPARSYWELGDKHFGDGLTARVPGELQRGYEQPERGRFHLRTDRAETALRDGPGFARARLGEATTPFVFAERDDRIRDPAGDWLGALGYDALFALDLAASPEGIAWRYADRVAWTDAGETLLDLEVLGRDRSRRFWQLGRVDQALDIDEYEVSAEPTDCMRWMLLGMRRLRSGHPDPLVALDESVTLYAGWASLDREDRERVRAGKPVGEGIGPEQSDACGQSTGRWLLARRAAGEDALGLYDDALAYLEREPWSHFAAAVLARELGRTEASMAHLQNAHHLGGGAPVFLAMAVVDAERGKLDVARAAYERLLADDPHPMFTAVAGYPALYPVEDGPWNPGFGARQVVRYAHGEPVDVERLHRDLRVSRWQTADAAWTLAATAALAELTGAEAPDLTRYEARSPDPWAARLLAPDRDVAAMARAVLAARFPELVLPEMKPIGPVSVQPVEE